MEREQANKFMYDLLRLMLSKKGSDLFLTVGFPPAIKIDGRMTPVSNQPLTSMHTVDLARSIMNDRQSAEFEANKECNFAINPAGIGRFRVNAFVQQGNVGVVLRVITTAIPKIEDPIEYTHPPRGCIITQREVGVDTMSWENALKNTLRQAPDVILIGEVRERETMEHAIAFAETGHLCLATLHANSANQALDRIINFFPEERRQQLLMDLSLNLRGMISQRLIPLKEGKGRCAAVEIMLNSPLISDLVFKGEVHEIKEIMKKSRELGMQTFDQALFDLFEAGKISYEDALRNADSVNDLRLNIKLHSKEAKNRDISQGLEHLNIV